MSNGRIHPFKRSLLPFLFTCLLVLLFVSLGIWQLDRASEKRRLMEVYEQRQREPPILLQQDESDFSELRYRKARITGQYDGGHQLLLDNQIRNGQAGYQVLTPLRMEDTNSAVLVNRGWIPVGANRSSRPRVDLRQERVSVVGTIEKFPSVGLWLQNAELVSGDWPAIVQVIDSRYLAAVLGYQLLPYQVLLDETSGEGYLRTRQPVQLSPEKHLAYAFQWFAFALTLPALVFWRSFRHEVIRKEGS
jgi:surfeit locus 1 family protein